VTKLRRATMEDADAVFRWRNDAAARAASRRGDVIDYATHSSWFAERLPLTHPETIWIIETANGVGIGSARINCYEGDDRSEISVVLGERYRNRGLGRGVIKQLAEMVRETGRVPTAFVRPDNRRSVNTFLSAGFSFVDTVVELQVKDET
jgi:RimJ/RimL family protein N-acetyltransferase